MLRLPPTSTLFPYTTLFRSVQHRPRAARFRGPEGSDRRCLGDLELPDDDVHPIEALDHAASGDRKSTRLNSSHRCISYAVFCLKKKKTKIQNTNHSREPTNL